MKMLILGLMLSMGSVAMAGGQTTSLQCALDANSLAQLEGYPDPGLLGVYWIKLPKQFVMTATEGSPLLQLSYFGRDAAGMEEGFGGFDEATADVLRMTSVDSKQIVAASAEKYTPVMSDRPVNVKRSLVLNKETLSGTLTVLTGFKKNEDLKPKYELRFKCSL